MNGFKNILNRSDVCSFLQELVLHDRFKNINIPNRFNNNKFIIDNFAFLIVMDALIKYSLIIEDEIYISDYLEQLRRTLKKITIYQDIESAINTMIGKICAEKLQLSNSHNKDNKEKILRHIYNKYIVNGYFYYGYLSSYENELEFIGIRKEGLIVDNKMKTINEILNKYNLDPLYQEENISITDNFLVATYHSYLSPIYLEKFFKSEIISNKEYNKTSIYKKEIKEIKEILLSLTTDNKFSESDKANFINTFLDILEEDKIYKSNPSIAFINRKSLGRNALKDFELIINNSSKMDLSSSISLIIGSRYESYEIYEDIPNIEIKTLKLPTYKEIEKGNYKYIELEEDKEEVKISELKEQIKEVEKEEVYYYKQKKNSYGVASLALLGLMLIALGSIINIILNIYK